MIHYPGTPISGPADLACQFYLGRHAFVSFAAPGHAQEVAECCQSFALDNGVFSAWRSGKTASEWASYYDWVSHWRRHPGFDWAVIPDVIDGSERANDRLMGEWIRLGLPEYCGVPVWHLHGSLPRLKRLARDWPRVAIGSSGAGPELAALAGTSAWLRP